MGPGATDLTSSYTYKRLKMLSNLIVFKGILMMHGSVREIIIQGKPKKITELKKIDLLSLEIASLATKCYFLTDLKKVV